MIKKIVNSFIELIIEKFYYFFHKYINSKLMVIYQSCSPPYFLKKTVSKFDFFNFQILIFKSIIINT